MKTCLTMAPPSAWVTLAFSLAMVLMSSSCGRPGEGIATGSDGPVDRLLGPAPAETDVERQWSRAWVDAAAGAAKPAGVEVVCLAQGWGALHWGENLDGGPLCLGGMKYTEGLATHAASDIRVWTALGAKRLRVLAGVDDNEKTPNPEASRMA